MRAPSAHFEKHSETNLKTLFSKMDRQLFGKTTKEFNTRLCFRKIAKMKSFFSDFGKMGYELGQWYLVQFFIQKLPYRKVIRR